MGDRFSGGLPRNGETMSVGAEGGGVGWGGEINMARLPVSWFSTRHSVCSITQGRVVESLIKPIQRELARIFFQVL